MSDILLLEALEQLALRVLLLAIQTVPIPTVRVRHMTRLHHGNETRLSEPTSNITDVNESRDTSEISA